jgi:ribosome-binding ATPase YchF (GTP1/OBG family)
VHGGVDPLFDIEVINMELIQADIETTKKRIENVSRDSKRGNEEAIKKHQALDKALAVLEAGKLVSLAGLTPEEKEYIADAHLITAKPILFVLNKKAGGKNLDEMGDERFTRLLDYITTSGAGYVIVDAKIEDELKASGDRVDDYKKSGLNRSFTILTPN